MLHNLRIIGALLLALTLCLPMSRCSIPANSPTIAQIFGPHVPQKPLLRDNYLLSGVNWNLHRKPGADSPYLILLAFLWPFGTLLLSYDPARRRWHQWAHGLEIIALFYAGLNIYAVGYFMGKFGQLLAGFYTGTAAAALCTAVWLVEIGPIIARAIGRGILTLLRNSRRRRPS